MMNTSRRAFLVGGLAAPVFVTRQEPDTGAAQLYIPGFAGRPRDRITDYENDPFIVGLEGGLRCTCGCNLDVYTCRTTDFTCAVSPAMHREVVALVEQGKTGAEIVEAFVQQHGETVLMAPKKAGFNWAAYVVPGTAIAVVGGIIAWVLLRRAHQMQPAATGVAAPELASADRDLLEAELTRLGR